MWRCPCAMVEALGEEGIIDGGGRGVFVPCMLGAWRHALSSAATKNLGSFRTSLVCARRAFSSEIVSVMLSEMPALVRGRG